MALNYPSNPSSGDTFTDSTTTWQWDGTSWNVVSASSSALQANTFKNISSDSGVTSANDPNDTLTVTGGPGIATSISDDTLTISYTGGGGGGGDQNLWFTINADSGSTQPDSTIDTLTVSGGTDISTSITNDTLTINYTGSGGGASSLNDLSDVNISGVQNGSVLYNDNTAGTFVPSNWQIGQMYLPAITMLYLTESNNAAYRFDQYGATNNPTVYAISGTTIAFDLNGVGGHPFEIQDPTSTPYSTGLVHVAPNGTVSTGANAQAKDSGILYWKVPFSISGNYRYQCTVHAPMVGAIAVKSIVSI
jgi:plastocyanin